MKCPNDNTTLEMTERGGVEIDYCPHCRGVWLDRGELDKIIERSAAQVPGSQAQQYGLDKNLHSGVKSSKKPRKKESFLKELFDF